MVLVDFAVSKSGLEPALAFAKALFAKLEAKGYRVAIAPHGDFFYRAEIEESEIPNQSYNNLWSPLRCTIVYIGTVAIGLTIIETAEKVEVRYENGKYVRVDQDKPDKTKIYSGYSWTTHKEFPTGKLCLQAYSPYPRTKWKKKWQEKKNLNKQISSIIKEFEMAAFTIADLVEKGRRQAEREHKIHLANMERWRIEEENRRKERATEESKRELHKIINNWAEINRIEQFFSEAEKKANKLSQSQRHQLLKRLEQARQFIGSTDALEHFLKWKSPNERLND